MINNIDPSSASRNILPDKNQSVQTGHVSSVESYTEESGADTSVYTNEKIVDIKKHMADTASDNLRYLVEELIQNQGKLRNRAVIDIHIVNEAKQLISEDGPYGVKAVSDRIVDFAIAISGGDTSKLGELKAAIEEGFEKAREAFGGTLPDICNQTHDEIMRKLDEWAGPQVDTPSE